MARLPFDGPPPPRAPRARHLQLVRAPAPRDPREVRADEAVERVVRDYLLDLQQMPVSLRASVLARALIHLSSERLVDQAQESRLLHAAAQTGLVAEQLTARERARARKGRR